MLLLCKYRGEFCPGQWKFAVSSFRFYVAIRCRNNSCVQSLFVPPKTLLKNMPEFILANESPINICSDRVLSLRRWVSFL